MIARSHRERGGRNGHRAAHIALAAVALVISLAPAGVVAQGDEAPSSPDASTGALSLADIIGTTVPAVPAGTSWSSVSGAGVTFEVPETWETSRTVPWLEGDGSSSGWVVLAGPDVNGLGSDFSLPGVAIGISSNPAGLTPRQVVAAEDYEGSCTPSPIGELGDGSYSASYRIWTACGDSDEAYLVVLAIAQADTPGLVALLLQGTSAADLAFFEHTLNSVQVGPVPGLAGTEATPAVATSPPERNSRGWSATLDECLLQMNDAIAYGTVTNTDDRSHGYRVYVRFLDATGLSLGESYWDTPAVEPGEGARYEVRLLAINGVTEATCIVSEVLVRD
jgi:hypothetical protein